MSKRRKLGSGFEGRLGFRARFPLVAGTRLSFAPRQVLAQRRRLPLMAVALVRLL